MQISIKHPLIDPNSNNLHDDIAKFLAENMKITNREMDTSLIVQKTSRPNTVILTFSDRRFKLFIFKACKNLRTANDEVSSDLYLNDNLTPYNFSILMSLKRERSRRRTENRPLFETIYSIDGKVFVKLTRGAPNQEAVNIKTPSMSLARYWY